MRVRADTFSRALRIHGSAASEFAVVAEAVRPEAWDRPIAAGKWSPAQITDHLIRSYDVLLREVQGGAGMKIRARPWMRFVLRLTYLPRILRGGWFPGRAPAPPEIRPVEDRPDQASAVALFRQRAREFETAVQERPDAPISHTFFGTMRTADGILFCARHIEHHRSQL